MNILICDDIRKDAERLELLLRDSGFHVHVSVFTHGSDALRYANTGAVIDVCFLDIIMPEMNGVDLAAKLRSGGYSGEIVFLSTSSEYGPESYGVKAFSYLLKPQTPESVKDILESLFDKREKADHARIMLKAPGIVKSVLLKDIEYVEVKLHRVHFKLTDGSETDVYMTLGEVAEKLLSDARFVQSHRSYIVNMNCISEVSEGKIIVRSGAMIPISRKYRDVRSKYYRWVF